MLPTPALTSGSSIQRGPFHYNPNSNSNGRSRGRGRSTFNVDVRATLRFLSGRSRLTNLGVVLLAAAGCLSLFYNLAFVFSSSSPSSYFSDVGLTGYAPPGSILATIRRDETLTRLSHLIVVPGHAIWKGSRREEVSDEDMWTLEDYQRGGGRVSAFVDHIEHGVRLASQDKNSLLVFSGGQTRLSSTTTEAESYMRLALSMDLFRITATGASTPFSRATTETYALDSYQNLLFSVARFHEVTGRYPSQITVVGYEMKRRRFEELHRAAIRFPAPLFEYIGLEPPASDDEAITARQGELKNGYHPYTLDIYGCHDFLASKRRGRNPFLRFHPYHASAPELRGLLEWCPDDPKAIYQGPLPWEVFG
ncbi:hypothetical protein JVT61DRAFT_10671 [Boletus reticuloceps]|uniref:DUF218 domain-containing protein n=1 Tax=Boletus reticuloceps TaxID=495285 RepID=A0A8I2YF78_9AGAM|nr:hypothetical protein JVT61DRAFT_10671 [Boletus reticuloceps]